MRLTFFGHASTCVEFSDTVLLTDPILRRRIVALQWTAAPPPPRQWTHADAVLISHLHLDHCDLPSLARLGRTQTMLVPRGAEPFFHRRGFRNVIGLRPGSSIAIAGVTITAVEARHDGRRYPLGPRAPAVGYLITSATGSVYFAGDTDLFAGMHDLAGRCDVALLPVWGWGRSVGDGHLDPIRAAEAVVRIRPALAVPIHWGALRPIWNLRATSRQPAYEFAAHVQARALPAEVRVLSPGTSTEWGEYHWTDCEDLEVGPPPRSGVARGDAMTQSGSEVSETAQHAATAAVHEVANLAADAKAERRELAKRLAWIVLTSLGAHASRKLLAVAWTRTFGEHPPGD